MLDMLNNPNLPQSLKTRQRMVDESQLVIAAGLSTTGWAATVASYHILANPEILQRLRTDLYKQIPPGQKRYDCTDLDWAELESLPYLQAVIKEALRLSYGITARLTRVTPKDIIYTEPNRENKSTDEANSAPKSWRIPANAPVSMSIPLTNHSEHIFPDSHKFNPDRWLGPNKTPEKYFVSFSKGARICPGMQLGLAELSLMIAGTVRWFDMELYETDERAVRLAVDASLPMAETHDGLRVKIKAELD